MLTKLSLALTASLLLTATATAEETKQPPTAPPQAPSAILCKTEAQAIGFASMMADGKTEPIAVNLVNRLAGLRFAEDGAHAWTASWITPFQGASLERGA